jgi:hypothetical protein
LGLPVAEEVVFLAVEAADCSTVGGTMHPAVRAAVSSIVRLVHNLLRPVEKIRTCSSESDCLKMPGDPAEAM